LESAKANASSQVKPSVCSTDSLSGYQVNILSDTMYSLSVVCLGLHTIATTTLPDNGKIKFDLGVGQTTALSVLFPIIKGGVEGSGNIVLTGYNQSRCVNISSGGIVTILSACP
jgi:hypothetical protein